MPLIKESTKGFRVLLPRLSELQMEFMLPIYRLLHFLGLALLLGGTIASWVLVRKEAHTVQSAKLAWNCMHLIAAPGLLILILTGVLQSSALYWEHFRGAGYMHVKVLLAVLIFFLLFFDMRTQKNIIKECPEPDVLVDMINKRQVIALWITGLILLIMWLVSYRPF